MLCNSIYMKCSEQGNLERQEADKWLLKAIPVGSLGVKWGVTVSADRVSSWDIGKTTDLYT